MELTKSLLGEGVMFILSEKFSQDPLEEHFAEEVARANENPTYYQFQKQELALNVMNSELISDLRGNISGKDNASSKTLDINDM